MSEKKKKVRDRSGASREGNMHSINKKRKKASDSEYDMAVDFPLLQRGGEAVSKGCEQDVSDTDTEEEDVVSAPRQVRNTEQASNEEEDSDTALTQKSFLANRDSSKSYALKVSHWLATMTGDISNCVQHNTKISQILISDNVRDIIHRNNISGDPEFHTFLKDNGLHVRTGKWTKQEDEILMANIKKFQSLQPEESVKNFLHPVLRDSEISVEVKRRRKDCKFLLQMAGNLNRLTVSCYKRARIIIQPFKTGTFTAEENQELKNYVARYGREWSRIGNLMNRWEQVVGDQWRLLEEDKKGKWSREEELALLNAIKDVTKTSDILQLDSDDVSWVAVAEKVNGRSRRQCREKWVVSMLSRKVKKSTIKQKTSANNRGDMSFTDTDVDIWRTGDYRDLVAHLFNLDVETEMEVDWESIAIQFDNEYSKGYLRKKWAYVRSRMKNYQLKTFQEQLEWVSESLCDRK